MTHFSLFATLRHVKGLLRNVILYSAALFVIPYLVPGVKITGGLWTYIFGGLMLTIMMTVIKPILNVLSFPFNLITLGIFSVFTNALILYLLTIFVTGIIIEPFKFAGTNVYGFIVPALSFNTLFAFLAASVVLSTIVTGVKWLIE